MKKMRGDSILSFHVFACQPKDNRVFFLLHPPDLFFILGPIKGTRKKIEIFDGSKRLRALGEVIPPIVRQELANHRE
jgi:hypothetical protein